MFTHNYLPINGASMALKMGFNGIYDDIPGLVNIHR